MTNRYGIVKLMDDFAYKWRGVNSFDSFISGYLNFDEINLKEAMNHNEEKSYSLISHFEQDLRKYTPKTSYEKLIFVELQRFVKEKKYIYKEKQIPILSQRIKRIILGCYIFFDIQTTTKLEKQEFLKTMIDCLNEILFKLNSNLMIYDINHVYLDYIIDYLKVKSVHNSFTSLFNKINNIVENFKRIKAKNPKVSRQKSTSEDLQYILHEVYGTNKSLMWWKDRIEDFIFEEINQLVSKKPIKNYVLIDNPDYIINDYIHSILDEFFKYDDWKFQKNMESPEIIHLPPMFNLITNEGFYAFKNGNGSLFLSNRLNSIKKFDTKKIAFLYSFVAHEVFPGHHQHYTMTNHLSAKYSDILKNPIGLEGWATYSEKITIEYGGMIERSTRLSILRKAIATLVYFESVLSNNTRATKLLETILSKSTILYQNYLDNKGFRTLNISYCIGLITMEDILGTLNTDTKKKFLTQGPLTPYYIHDFLNTKSIYI